MVRLFGLFARKKPIDQPKPEKKAEEFIKPTAYAGQLSHAPFEASIWDGGKFPGGFGPTQLQFVDYWTLRARSAQLFNENLYAHGIIKRLITNVISTGLIPEPAPKESILGFEDDGLAEWVEDVQARFDIWDKNPILCDFKLVKTFGDLQSAAFMEALISGDVLVVIRQNRTTRLPQIQLISGTKVRTPFETNTTPRAGNTIVDGVELDSQKRVVAYWIVQEDQTSKRLPVFGERSGRRIAWLLFGAEKRLDDVRGMPLLSLILQSLKEIDRYRDSAQRKAVVNSILAMFIKKTEDKMGTLPMTGGAIRKDSIELDNNEGGTRNYNIASMYPGVVMEELQTGEEPVGFHSQGTDIDFPKFEQAIIQAISWTLEIPPESLTLSFNKNYSASQAAINEFKAYINKIRTCIGRNLCTPIYIEWLLSETLNNKVQAPGLLDSWRNPAEQDIFGAWTAVDWYGSIKPSTDMLKQAKASKDLIDEGLSTHSIESRSINGTNWNINIKKLARENTKKVEALRPLAEFWSEFTPNVDAAAFSNLTAEERKNISLKAGFNPKLIEDFEMARIENKNIGETDLIEGTDDGESDI